MHGPAGTVAPIGGWFAMEDAKKVKRLRDIAGAPIARCGVLSRQLERIQP
jgi:hypothetical protein